MFCEPQAGVRVFGRSATQSRVSGTRGGVPLKRAKDSPLRERHSITPEPWPYGHGGGHYQALAVLRLAILLQRGPSTTRSSKPS